MDSCHDGREAELPVIRGLSWFGRVNGALMVRIEVPVPFDQAVAVLHGVAQPGDLLCDEDLLGCVAVTLLIEGLPGLEVRAAMLRDDEERGAVASPGFLARCRQRVSGLLPA
jgi:hypothetical protein